MPLRIKSATYIKSIPDLKQLPKDLLPEIAFAGRSNVGKSSALNLLVKIKNLAKTSSTPGKTKLINFFLINKNLYFVDLPGYGYAKASKSMRKSWGKLVEDYLKERKNLKGTVLLIDSRRGPLEPDLQLSEWLDFYGKRKLIVLTKTDKLSRSALLSNVKKTCQVLNLNSDSLVLFSAKTGEEKDKILKWIAQVIKK
ncbi:MAG: YihA family ribosome biogenesis GTP-binding protein [candidate division Zixibacteria bacterium]|nr:YihA family ribosome biogenesis GTP-binding protein [candidate division Zixibacteria bacterium]